MVLGGWLDVAWGLEAGFWSLVAGFGRPGDPQNLKHGASKWFYDGFWAGWGEVGGGYGSLLLLTSHSLVAPCKQGLADLTLDFSMFLDAYSLLA